MTNRRTWIIALAAVLVFAAAAFAAIGPDKVGTYRGTFIGVQDRGTFLVRVNNDGSIDGTAYSNVDDTSMMVTGMAEPDGTAVFSTIECPGTPISFSGKIDFMNRLLGKWTYEDNSGSGSFNAMIQ